jgi:predicted transcriptional regulator
MPKSHAALSPLEHEVMRVLWARGSATAADVGAALPRRLTNATVRTLLRRLEAKGYLRHGMRGRAFVYEPSVAQSQAATGALRSIVRRFFGGSASRLVAGLVDEGLIGPDEVRALSKRLKRARGRKRPS